MSWTSSCLLWSSLALWTNQPPITFQLHRDYIAIAEGSIGGLAGLKFVLDTGSNPTVIHERVARQLRLATRPDALNLVGGAIALEAAVLSELSLGGITARELEVLVQDLDPLERELGSRIDAILGLDVLAQRNLAIDYHRKLLHFRADPGEPRVAMETRQGFVAVPVEISGIRVRLALDTGASGIVLFENRLRGRLPRLRATGTRTSTGLGGARVDRLVELPRVRIGDYEFGPVQAAMTEASPGTLPGCDGLMGVRALGVQMLAIDFVNSGIVLRGKSAISGFPGFDASGISAGEDSPPQFSDLPGPQK
jgi:predicted aspartyl protease